MYDQAQRLRQMFSTGRIDNRPKPSIRVMAVTSGKGGVGKSNFSLNFALALTSMGKKVVVLDADVGFANIDVLIGKSPGRTLADLILRRVSIWDILELGPLGIHYIAGGSGLQDLLSLKQDQVDYLVDELEELQGFADYLIIDTGAGLTEGTLRFILSADDIITVCTPEPTAITDAYALIKLVVKHNPAAHIQLVVNRVTSAAEGKQVADKLVLVTNQFLHVQLQTLGYVFDDPKVSKAVKEQVPFYLQYPDSAASRSIDQLAKKHLNLNVGINHGDSGIRSFLSRMTHVFRN
ncbi:MinD/ParA family protein [Effusibacillus lacus]|uniref:Cobyrinic acid a,c-diamide synthase n=1 Tax=Effusibacillus lacus TaxID=1348429 RepID=A0A292YDT4_9BACL|nr:MinD/ParA family protein [Effusibacillus lacus]TCS73138.1 flagellar biosynthesis protein FlhG [Effusibacillus lacus]GAX90542.1 cobyrinic acid a,c-diamide synthase [Effusibacillus lacus]